MNFIINLFVTSGIIITLITIIAALYNFNILKKYNNNYKINKMKNDYNKILKGKRLSFSIFTFIFILLFNNALFFFIDNNPFIFHDDIEYFIISILISAIISILIGYFNNKLNQNVWYYYKYNLKIIGNNQIITDGIKYTKAYNIKKIDENKYNIDIFINNQKFNITANKNELLFEPII